MEKNTSSLMAGMILCGASLMSGGCQKAIDYIKDHENGQVDCKACNIQQISVLSTDELGAYTVTYAFNYNTAGDPLTVKNTAVATGNPNAVFKYDKYGRMKELIRPYENQNFETWVKYTYNIKGQIIRDTQYNFGTYIDSVPVPFPNITYGVSQFSYDMRDRIIGRVDSFFFDGNSAETSTVFQYDANGNLIGQGNVYDTQLSFLRTNRIWMFLACNYSINNNFQALRYNANRLPLLFSGSYNSMPLIVSQAGQFKIIYACN
jgi:hypothetical protein